MDGDLEKGKNAADLLTQAKEASDSDDKIKAVN